MNVVNNITQQKHKDNRFRQKPVNVKLANIGTSLMGPPLARSNASCFTPCNAARDFRDPRSTLSARSKSSTTRSDSHIILAICEGRGNARGIVGLAAIDIHRPCLILSQLTDTHTYTSTLTKLNILHPTEVLIPASFVETATPTRLLKIINDLFPSINVSCIPRSEFNRTRGLQLITTICAPKYSSVHLIVQDKFFAAAASFALIRYVENIRHVVYASKTIKIEYNEPEHTTLIDIDTVNRLNLVAPYRNSAAYSEKLKNPSLLAILDHCVTNVGRRLLRTTILQPPCNFKEIETRLDCVQELLEQPELLAKLREVLIPLANIECALTFGTLLPASAENVSERQLNYTLQLKGLLTAVEPLANELKSCKHPVFYGIYNRLTSLNTCSTILQLIGAIINEDAHLSKGQAGETQRCFAIKAGINGFLDLTRRVYTEEVDNMISYVDELSKTYNLPLRVQHTMKMGYHIISPCTKVTRNMKKTDFPPNFLKIEQFRNHYTMTTTEMINFGRRLKKISLEIQSISNIIIYKLLIEICPHIGDLYQLCDDIALLDTFVSIAQTSSAPSYVRPRLSTSYMNLENFRHCVLEHISDSEPVANSVCMVQTSNVHLITGPNMSGKSVYVRSICLLQILSQIGCKVPAQKATVRPCDRIYAQLTSDGQLECGGISSFALEMNKISYLMNTMTNNSLIVLDELCRTTECNEGMSIAFAICEELARKKAFTFLVTHYLSLTVLPDLYPNITNWHLESLEQMQPKKLYTSLKFTFKVKSGVTKVASYGIKLSRICISGNSISDRAEELFQFMLPAKKNLNVTKSSSTEYLQRKLQGELDILKAKGQLLPQVEKEKIDEFEKATGTIFVPLQNQPSFISAEVNSDQTENLKTSEESNINKQKIIQQSLDSKSSSKLTKSIFSLPQFDSNKSDKNEEDIQKNIFAVDMNENNSHIELNDSFQSSELTFSASLASFDNNPLNNILKFSEQYKKNSTLRLNKIPTVESNNSGSINTSYSSSYSYEEKEEETSFSGYLTQNKLANSNLDNILFDNKNTFEEEEATFSIKSFSNSSGNNKVKLFSKENSSLTETSFNQNKNSSIQNTFSNSTEKYKKISDFLRKKFNFNSEMNEAKKFSFKQAEEFEVDNKSMDDEKKTCSTTFLKQFDDFNVEHNEIENELGAKMEDTKMFSSKTILKQDFKVDNKNSNKNNIFSENNSGKVQNNNNLFRLGNSSKEITINDKEKSENQIMKPLVSELYMSSIESSDETKSDIDNFEEIATIDEEEFISSLLKRTGVTSTPNPKYVSDNVDQDSIDISKMNEGILKPLKRTLDSDDIISSNQEFKKICNYNLESETPHTLNDSKTISNQNVIVSNPSTSATLHNSAQSRDECTKFLSIDQTVFDSFLSNEKSISKNNTPNTSKSFQFKLTADKKNSINSSPCILKKKTWRPPFKKK